MQFLMRRRGTIFHIIPKLVPTCHTKLEMEIGYVVIVGSIIWLMILNLNYIANVDEKNQSILSVYDI